ncbi:hypothetical protein [Butyrivibrio sp. WCE2006]|uniref:hypothetical protein n=1 Tax=Butyrivibrio sp. WCE2006 TaxID=1410611 RepID=UPI0005D14B22|nr:hypothetical protein [Butyrivibrio sp. WCE2006]
MKGLKKFLLTTATVFAAFTIAGGVKAQAANYELGLNEEKSFSLSNNEEDTILFTTPETGSFHVEVVLTDTLRDGESVSYGNVFLTSTMVNDYKTIWSNSSLIKGKGWIVSPEYCFAPGSRVSISLKPNFSDITYNYNVKIVNDADKFYEKETNNTPKKATSIKVKKIYSGVINDGDDVDWFVFKAPKTKKYKFYAVNTEKVHGWTSFTGFKSKTKADGNYTGIYSESGWKKIKTVSLKKGQKYYIKVARGYNNNATYKIRVK